MKLFRFDDGHIGIDHGDGAHDATSLARPLTAAYPGPGDPLIACLPELRRATGAAPGPALDLEAIATWLSPVERPTKIVAAPNNYHSHSREMALLATSTASQMRDLREAGLFLKANSSLVGPSNGIALRFPGRRTDHELELVAVIGTPCDRVTEAAALDYVAGYSLGLDITVRGPEERSLRKSSDTFTVLGPWLVSADEYAAAGDVTISLSLNGERRQHTAVSDMIYGVASLIEYASRYYTLYPGDLLYTGTPAGVGPIVAGDRIALEGGCLGACEVRVRAG